MKKKRKSIAELVCEILLPFIKAGIMPRFSKKKIGFRIDPSSEDSHATINLVIRNIPVPILGIGFALHREIMLYPELTLNYQELGVKLGKMFQALGFIVTSLGVWKDKDLKNWKRKLTS